jgi:hypothetical protein
LWGTYLNRRGSSEVEFRNTLLSRVASLEGRVAEQEHELYKERQKNLDQYREYGELLVKYEALQREVEELRPLKDEVDKLRKQVEEYERRG